MVSPGGLLSSERQLQQLQLDRLHLQGYTGKGFTIAVFDNGFTSVDKLGPYRHLFKNKQIKHCKNFVDPKRSVYEMGTDGDHGSRVLSVLAALMPPNFVGAAYDANYLLAITEDMTKEGVLEEWNWLMAAEWADSLGVDIISTSLGYATNFTYGGDHTFEEMDGKTTFISRAANLAASRGILVVNAMGNEGESAWKHMNAPADADSCLAVGSVNADENYSTFSSIGPTYDQRIKPDVVAMGEFTITLLPQGWLKTGVGTSFACPLMAGYAACVWQIEPSKTNMEIFNLIKESGSNAKQPNNTIGWGVPKADSIYFWLKGAHLPMGGSIKNYFTIYPNPGNSLINLSYYNYDKTSSCLVKVYNNLGEQLFTKHFEILEGFGIYPLDMRELHLQKGMYYLKIEGLGSEIIFEKKLMIIE
jgi:subtilisin family serine protease